MHKEKKKMLNLPANAGLKFSYKGWHVGSTH